MPGHEKSPVKILDICGAGSRQFLILVSSWTTEQAKSEAINPSN